MPEDVNEKRMKLRYAGSCRMCGGDLPARTDAIYERTTKTVRCLECRPPDLAVADTDADPVVAPVVDPVIEAGVPGASARREYERRQARRAAHIREKHPRLGGFILAVTDDPQSTTAWSTGAIGEEQLGQKLNALACESIRFLHDRRIPGTRANIDHLAVTPSGIYVIDAKRYRGRPSLKLEGGILRPRTATLLVGSRDCTKLVDGVLKQVDVVRGVLGDDVPVVGVLCFIEADWPLIGGAFTTRGVEVLWPKRLYARLQDGGSLASEVGAMHRSLAAALPPA